MSEASLFMPKKKNRAGVSANRQPRTTPAVAGPSTSIAGTTLPRKQVGPPKPTLPTASSSQPSIPSSSSSSADVKPNSKITEIKLYSTDPGSNIRSSIMKFMSARDFDPCQITKPIYMNRKQPGAKELPVHALDDDGKIVGKYQYDEAGKPVLAANGQPIVDKVDVGLDPEMVGGGSSKRKLKKGVKEVFHQDLNIIRMKREEATPWVLETGKPRPQGQAQALGHVPDHWVGRMVEQSSLPTVLLVNDGRESGFQVVPLARTYRFTPERPFKTLDADAANRLFEHQMKHKVHDRWSQRPDGPTLMGNIAGPSSGVKTEHDDMASRWENRMRGGSQPTRVKVERYEDDFKREGRQQERGMEGGVDEELDYDATEDFQDDDENNTFYHDQEEEEETKYQEEQIKKEQRLANASVGDRPQIDNADDEDDLFGEGKLNVEGKRLRKMMRERGGGDDYDSSDSDSSDSSETIKDDKSEKSVKDDKEKEKEKEKEKSAPGSAERPSRPPSRGPSFRQTTSPGGGNSGKRPNYPQHGKSGTAPPGSGAAFLAHRATGSRGASPKARSRGNSPHNRATSPESRDGRGMSPPSRDQSPVRQLSPGRENSPGANTQQSQHQHNRPPGGLTGPGGKRKTATASPQPPGNPNSPKRKPSPTPSNGSTSEPRSKKKKSSTPDVAPFPNQIMQLEVVDWFKSQTTAQVAMSACIKAFKPKLLATAAEYREANQKLFMRWVNDVTVKEAGKLVLKPEYRS